MIKRILLSLAAFTARLLPTSVKKALYRFEPLAKLIRGGLNLAAPSGLTEITVAAGALEGMALSLDLQTEKDYWLGTYEPELQAAVQELVRPGMVAYDVGANLGYVTLMLSQAVGETGQVFAFEALPANLERLRANLALNALPSPVTVVPGAVAERAAPVEFLVHASGGMGKAAGSAGREADYQETITVPGISLDAFVYERGNPAPQAVKMDIEGGEILALPGMSRLLAEARPVILLELHGPDAARVVWETLSAAGYHICRMSPGYPTIDNLDELDELDWKAYLVAKPK